MSTGSCLSCIPRTNKCSFTISCRDCCQLLQEGAPSRRRDQLAILLPASVPTLTPPLIAQHPTRDEGIWSPARFFPVLPRYQQEKDRPEFSLTNTKSCGMVRASQSRWLLCLQLTSAPWGPQTAPTQCRHTRLSPLGSSSFPPCPPSRGRYLGMVDWVEDCKIKVAMNRMFNFMCAVKVILVCCGSTWSQPVVR